MVSTFSANASAGANTSGNGSSSNDGGGSGGSISGSWDDEHSSTLWGWLSGIFDGLASIWEGIASLPSAIGHYITSGFTTLWGWLSDLVGAIGNGFTTLWGWLGDLVNNIISLPSKIYDLIIEGIKSIFVPDTEEIKRKFEGMTERVEFSLGIVDDGFDDMKDSWEEKPLDNIEENYNIPGVGNMKLKFFDTEYLKQGIERFRPVIRGFLVLLMFFYNYYQVLSFINQDPGIHASAHTTAIEHLKGKGGDN